MADQAPLISRRPAWLKHLSPTTLLLTPLKQHIGCCIAVPLLLKFLGGVALVQAFIRNPYVEVAVLALVLPPAVFAVLKGEDAWRIRHARKHAAAHDPCDHHCDPFRASFARRYAVNLAIAFGVAVILHLIFHRHGN